jgi:hypothetical protein
LTVSKQKNGIAVSEAVLEPYSLVPCIAGFDYNTISDVILQIRYTARQGIVAASVNSSVKDILQAAIPPFLPWSAPYTSINCTVTLVKSSIRKSALLKDGAYARQGVSDDRFVDYAGAAQAVVTSTASSDSGMFETNLRDERFVPFELSGAISTWQLATMRDTTIVSYQNEDVWKQRLAVADESHAYVLVLGPDGHLRWRNSGAFNEGRRQIAF